MLTLIKSDLYRLWKSRGTKVCLWINLLFAVASILISSGFTKLLIVAGEVFEGVTGISTLTQSLNWSMIVVLLTTVAITLFTTAGFSNETTKYPISKGYSRGEVYLSHLVIVSIYAVIMLLVQVGVSTGIATLLWGFGNFTIDMLSGSLYVIGIQILLHIALASFMLMTSMLIKRVGEAIACNVLIITAFAGIICSIINRMIEGVDSSIYWILNNMLYLTNPMPSTVDVTRGIMVAIGFCVFSMLVGILTFTRYEFK